MEIYNMASTDHRHASRTSHEVRGWKQLSGMFTTPLLIIAPLTRCVDVNSKQCILQHVASLTGCVDVNQFIPTIWWIIHVAPLTRCVDVNLMEISLVSSSDRSHLSRGVWM